MRYLEWRNRLCKIVVILFCGVCADCHQRLRVPNQLIHYKDEDKKLRFISFYPIFSHTFP